jgi:hypothetical protein
MESTIMHGASSSVVQILAVQESLTKMVAINGATFAMSEAPSNWCQLTM